jgi:hypothetical protein
MIDVNLDLYELYKERMGNENIVNPKIFYILIRITLACDAMHDFIEPRGKTGSDLWLKRLSNNSGFNAYKNRLLNDSADRVIRDCAKYSLVNMLNEIISGYPFSTTGLNVKAKLISLFRNDKKAKETVDNVHVILSLAEQNTIDMMSGDRGACADFKLLDLIRSLDIINTDIKKKMGPTQYNLTIDTTSDKTNLTPFLSELMNRIFKTKNNCINLSSRFHIINSYATDYDASNENALSKVFKSMDLSEDLESDMKFNITSNGAIVFQGSLKKEAVRVRLKVDKYFTENFNDNYMISSSDGPDSVNKITDSMLNSFTAPGSNPDEIINLTIFKTMGDFLQIMSHLGLKKSKPNDVNVFISFDTLCAKIAGIFDRNVLYEKKFTSDATKLSTGLYSFFSANQYNDALRAKGLPTFEPLNVDDDDVNRKRRRLEFAKPHQKMIKFGKKQKVKKLPNKSLMTKLKSVGIKITKKQEKRRVYLSRPELIKRATAFKNLQLRAKKLKVRIMYKNKKGKYVYKTAKRLTFDIKRNLRKKNPNVKRIKQKFG